MASIHAWRAGISLRMAVSTATKGSRSSARQSSNQDHERTWSSKSSSPMVLFSSSRSTGTVFGSPAILRASFCQSLPLPLMGEPSSAHQTTSSLSRGWRFPSQWATPSNIQRGRTRSLPSTFVQQETRRWPSMWRTTWWSPTSSPPCFPREAQNPLKQNPSATRPSLEPP